MNLYQMKSNPQGRERIAEFLEHNFVSPGLEESLDAVKLFVHDMQDGDYVLIAELDRVHLGDLGDYFYEDSPEARDKGLCHRRGVTWLVQIPRAELNAEVRLFLEHPETVSKFPYPVDQAQLYRWSSNLLTGNLGTARSAVVDEDTIAEALEILKSALRCSDAERRERAAAAILRYAKS
ncbi:hypothetical protein [Paenibacillus sp. sgz500958]|uniref:hypothetical protein n=1 Tax=Paenibacillus sp. sgz500958 TaxID=3242475 RepID=UPI0036D3E460